MAALPEGWTEHQDAEGRTFYYNATSGESSWEVPAATYAPEAPAPSPYAAEPELPSGWAAYEDPEGRKYYANASTGETSWDRPAAPAPAKPMGEWSTECTYTIGPEGNEAVFTGKAPLLDRGTYGSVVATVASLNNNEVPGVECGYCVIFSNSKQNYFMLWRSDKEVEAFTALGIQEEYWAVEQAKDLGPKGSESIFAGKVQVLDETVYNSVTATIESLNKQEVQCDVGYCVMYSASQMVYYLLWKYGKQEEAYKVLGLG
mmetsp:Transcript_108523/g.305895  ORF Transcript_108523/g.305895 Transcript_108523/m.305895 type:complete len:260 (+) Transcript_108523:109-888(+)